MSLKMEVNQAIETIDYEIEAAAWNAATLRPCDEGACPYGATTGMDCWEHCGLGLGDDGGDYYEIY